MIRSLLQVPLGLKLVVANGILLAAAVVVGAGMGRAEPLPGEVGGFVVIGGILTGMIGINWILVKIALGPLKGLQQAADRVSRGNLEARVPHSPVADPALLHLTRTFNQMVDATARTQEARDRLSRDLLAAGERDRKALAEELLSGPAQTLSTALLLLRRSDGGADSRGLGADVLRGALEELRRISAALHPPELDELGLANALRALTRARIESRGIGTEVVVEGTEEGLPSGVRLGAFRLLQEGVETAARLKGLRAMKLWLRKDGPFLLAHVGMRGAGDGDGTGLGMGEGLHRMFERTRLLGGEMEVQAGPGSELSILIRLPLEEARTLLEPSAAPD
jgi:two-component system, NarL family, sensor histidine kinase UhpB